MTAKIDNIARARLEGARQAFRDHVQSVAFHLTLSRKMIDALVWVKETDWSDHSRHFGSLQVGTFDSLKRRGLVYHDWREGWPKGHKVWGLTPAGELVFSLLVEAGLVVMQTARKATGVK